jgi:hypothetical protein
MAEVQWYYARDDQPMGPVSVAELKQLVDSGQLKPDDLLWREGMDAWTTAINLRGLFGGEAGDKPDVAAAVPSLTGEAPARPRPRVLPPGTRARLESLVRATQMTLWITCVLVVLVGFVLFTRAFLSANQPEEEAAAGAVFATFFIGAYVLARCGEKLSRILLAHSRRRRR